MNINHMRKLAGLPPLSDEVLNERFNDDYDDYDDDLDPAEAELIKAAEKDLKKAGVEVDDEDVDPAQDEHPAEAARRAAREERKQKSAGDRALKQSAEQLAKGVENKKAETATATRARRGRQEFGRTTEFRDWVKNNPDARRADALKFAATLGMSAAHANTKFYQFKKQLKEFWVVVNPASAKVLAEGATIDFPKWVSFTNVHEDDAEIFASQKSAEATARSFTNAGISTVLMKF